MGIQPLSIASRARQYVIDAAIIAVGSLIILLCYAHLAAPRTPLGLLSLLSLAIGVQVYPLADEDPGRKPGDRRDSGVLPPLVSSTPLLAVIALYGLPWAVVTAVLVRALGSPLLGLRRRCSPPPLVWYRDIAGAAVAALLAATLYDAIADGKPLSLPIPALPALFAAEGALVCTAWGLVALRTVARRQAFGAQARRGLLEALPALASEPALAFVLAGAVAAGQSFAVLAAALPVVALIGGLRWHMTTRRRLEQVRARLEVQATTDPLTGLANRGMFERTLAARLTESTRHGRPLAVLLIDLDAFKSVNDAYGHACGDAVLVAVAGALRRGLRGSDLPARLGGDEFVALLPETDTARALLLAQRVCAEIAALEVPAGAAIVYPTASVGAAATTDCAHVDAAGLLAAADHAAYAAKRAGKNTARLAA